MLMVNRTRSMARSSFAALVALPVLLSQSVGLPLTLPDLIGSALYTIFFLFPLLLILLFLFFFGLPYLAASFLESIVLGET